VRGLQFLNAATSLDCSYIPASQIYRGIAWFNLDTREGSCLDSWNAVFLFLQGVKPNTASSLLFGNER